MDLHDLLRGRSDRIASPREEYALIARAQLGDDAAQTRLVAAYRDVINAAVRRRVGQFDEDEAQAIAVEGLLRAINKWEASGDKRLAAVAKLSIMESFRAASEAKHGISYSTVYRVTTALTEAQGDVARAQEIAATGDAPRVRPEVFLAALTLLRSGSVEAESITRDGFEVDTAGMSSLWASEADDFSAAEQRVLCDVAFRAVNDLERSVCRLTYGFDEYAPMPMAEVAERLGLSRAKAIRTRESALAKMRDALGATS